MKGAYAEPCQKIVIKDNRANIIIRGSRKYFFLLNMNFVSQPIYLNIF